MSGRVSAGDRVRRAQRQTDTSWEREWRPEKFKGRGNDRDKETDTHGQFVCVCVCVCVCYPLVSTPLPSQLIP